MRAVLLLRMISSTTFAVHALSWPGRQSGSLNPQYLEDSEPDIWRSGELSSVLDNHDKLESYARRPDCFRRITDSIRVQCGDLDMNEDERVQAAISMTICELATAKHSPPLECSSVIPLTDEPSATSQTLRADSCVEALSRSAQYWSSYSGYLREIPQLCHAFRRWNDIDTAKDIYRNTSLEAISILRAINYAENRQHDFYKGIDEISQHLRHLVHDMNKINTDMGESALGVVRRMQDENEQVVTLLQHTVTSALEIHSDTYHSLFHELSEEMRGIVHDHAGALNLLVPSLQATFEAQLAPTLEETRRQFQDVNDVAFIAQSNWRAVGVEFGHMQETVSSLAHSIADTVSVLDTHVDQAVLANRVQLEATNAADRLGRVLTELTTFTHSEMAKMNDTATAIHDKWIAASSIQIGFLDRRQWDEWTRYVFQSLLQVILRVDPDVLDHIFSSPILRFSGFVCRALWYIIYTGMASLTGTLLLVVSSRCWVFSRKESSAPDLREATCHSSRQEKPLYSRAQFATCSPALTSHPSLCSRRTQDRFSRIPDRLCRTPTV
ncbi:hypothetical protein BDY19DRAFT_942582 [Irpex rosettiformis]|uniref:Uncharacterized protein n=1 Tax=Irpex rosettiformis TaxID=378272 RepID=A0ACB8U5M9_9APHY|nr:hypothetical protein BDY19DRAFT_942582 [Irpex rosettiformis]